MLAQSTYAGENGFTLRLCSMQAVITEGDGVRVCLFAIDSDHDVH